MPCHSRTASILLCVAAFVAIGACSSNEAARTGPPRPDPDASGSSPGGGNSEGGGSSEDGEAPDEAGSIGTGAGGASTVDQDSAGGLGGSSAAGSAGVAVDDDSGAGIPDGGSDADAATHAGTVYFSNDGTTVGWSSAKPQG